VSRPAGCLAAVYLAATSAARFNALVFLYREVLKIELEGIDAVRAKRQQHLPVVLTQDEVKVLLAGVKGDAGLAVKLLYETSAGRLRC
jgi:integrase